MQVLVTLREARLNILGGFSFFLILIDFYWSKMLVPTVQQSESILRIYIYLYSFLDFLSILNELLTSYCFNLK